MFADQEQQHGFSPPSGQSVQPEILPASSGARLAKPVLVTIDPVSLPGICQSQWPSLSNLRAERIESFDTWKSLSFSERVAAERSAVIHYLNQHSLEYQATLIEASRQSARMPAQQCLSIVIPAYNEHDNIGGTVGELIKLINLKDKGYFSAQIGIVVVLNRPTGHTDERDMADRQSLKQSSRILLELSTQYPEIDLCILQVEAPREIACVGLARKVGHDFTALRSLERSGSVHERNPHYIQTFDADTAGIHQDFLENIFVSLKSHNFSKDVYRQSPSFPRTDMQQTPLLHALNSFWYGTTAALAERTDNPWTAGAGILVSLYAHSSAGGVFPFRFERGVDEDLRIGVHAYKLRASREAVGDLQGALFDTDPRRWIVVNGDLLQELQSSDLNLDTRELPEKFEHISSALLTYLDFNSASLRAAQAPRPLDCSWLETSESFKAALPLLALETLANGYRSFVERTLRFAQASSCVREAQELQAQFLSGKCARSESNLKFDAFFNAAVQSADTEPELRATLLLCHARAAEQADEIIASLLEQMGLPFEFVEQPQERLPESGKIERRFRFYSYGDYSKRLKELLST